MATLDQLGRKDLIKVLDNIRYGLMFQERMETNYNYVLSHMNGRSSAAARTGMIMYAVIAGIDLAIMFPLGTVLLFITALSVEGKSTSDPTAYLAFFVAIIVFLLVMVPLNIFMIKKAKKANRKRRKEAVHFSEGLAPYLPFYQEKYALAQSYLNQIYTDFHVHDRLKHIDVLDYTIRELQTSSRITLEQAVDNYYKEQHREAMRNEAAATRKATEQIQKDNAEYHRQMIANVQNLNAQQQLQNGLLQRQADMMYLHMN